MNALNLTLILLRSNYRNPMNMKKLYPLAVMVLSASMATAQVSFQNHSKSPNLVTINTTDFPGVQAFSLVGSFDTLAQTPTWRFGGSADGAGILKNSNGTFTYILNHEDNFSVSRITLDNTFKPVKGEYLLNSNGGMWRLCSATMATPQTHGFGPLFLTCGETSAESMTHYLNPYGSPITDSTTSAVTTIATGLGKWNAENALPLPAVAFPGKTVILVGDDDSGTNGGQVVMYVSNAVGDLNNGTLYVMRRVDQNQRERDIPVSTGTVAVEFVPIPGYTTMTGAQIDAYANATLKSIKFQRVEDLDYRKGNAKANRQIFFNATGQVNSDTTDRTLWGRVYELKLDSLNPLVGSLRCVLNGDNKASTNPARVLYQPDNICVTEDYVYVQEDPNGYTFPGASAYIHDARIYQYDIETEGFKQLLEIDHHRHANDSAIYNRNSAGTAFQTSGTGGWEFGALVDVSKETGVDNSFVLSLQPHSWRYPFFAGVDGGTKRTSENQGSLLITLTGLPRIKAKVPVASSKSICSGTTATLTATGGSNYAATNGTTYKWYTQAVNGTAVFTGSVFVTPILSNNATYYVESSVSGSTSASRTQVNVTVTATPGQPTISQTGNVLSSNAATGNQWYRNGNLIPGATGTTYTVTVDGYYSVAASNGNCASVRSSETMMTLTGIEEMTDAKGLNVFPNPNDGTFTIHFKTPEESKTLNVRVINTMGQVVFEDGVSNFNGSYAKTINIGDLSNGAYHVTIYTDSKVYKQTISKQ